MRVCKNCGLVMSDAEYVKRRADTEKMAVLEPGEVWEAPDTPITIHIMEEQPDDPLLLTAASRPLSRLLVVLLAMQQQEIVRRPRGAPEEDGHGAAPAGG